MDYVKLDDLKFHFKFSISRFLKNLQILFLSWLYLGVGVCQYRHCRYYKADENLHPLFGVIISDKPNSRSADLSSLIYRVSSFPTLVDLKIMTEISNRQRCQNPKSN